MPQPPASPLYERLVAQLGRPLDQVEAGFVLKGAEPLRQYQLSPAHRKRPQPVVSSCISVMAGRASISGRRCPRTTTNSGSTWPRNCVAGIFRCPDYMAAITDFSMIEADLKQWERQKEVAHWQAWFETNEAAAPSTAETLDLRLAFLADGSPPAMAHPARRAVFRFEAGAGQTLQREYRARHVDDLRRTRCPCGPPFTSRGTTKVGGASATARRPPACRSTGCSASRCRPSVL